MFIIFTRVNDYKKKKKKLFREELIRATKTNPA